MEVEKGAVRQTEEYDGRGKREPGADRGLVLFLMVTIRCRVNPLTVYGTLQDRPPGVFMGQISQHCKTEFGAFPRPQEKMVTQTDHHP